MLVCNVYEVNGGLDRDDVVNGLVHIFYYRIFIDISLSSAPYYFKFVYRLFHIVFNTGNCYANTVTHPEIKFSLNYEANTPLKYCFFGTTFVLMYIADLQLMDYPHREG